VTADEIAREIERRYWRRRRAVPGLVKPGVHTET
jgi:hypothetical protein